MLTRRHIRIKVLQALYSFEQSAQGDLVPIIKELTRSLNRIEELYLYELRIFSELFKYAEERIERNRNKLMPTQEDLNPNLKFVQNSVLKALDANYGYAKACEDKHVSWGDYRDIIRRIANEFFISEEYLAYMKETSRSLKEDKYILKLFYAKFITSSEVIQNHYEDIYLHWADDLDAAQMMVTKTIKNFQETATGDLYSRSSFSKERSEALGNGGALPEDYQLERADILVDLFKDEDDAQFGQALLRKTAALSKELESLISVHTRNWDMDRIALVDILLMKMALAEMMSFQQIPVKVTLNEYIDLSKEYSTPKSSQFINGILDKAVAQLKEEGKIVKIGRGLL